MSNKYKYININKEQMKECFLCLYAHDKDWATQKINWKFALMRKEYIDN